MSNVFDYYLNLKGNIVGKIDGLIDKTIEFQTSISRTQTLVEGLGRASIGLESISNVVNGVSEVFSGITETDIRHGCAEVTGRLCVIGSEIKEDNLKTLFGGNAEAADDMYKRISEYGKVTPYDKAGLLEAQRTMMSFGMSGEAAFSTLQQIGDIAMGDSQKLQSLGDVEIRSLLMSKEHRENALCSLVVGS